MSEEEVQRIINNIQLRLVAEKVGGIETRTKDEIVLIKCIQELQQENQQLKEKYNKLSNDYERMYNCNCILRDNRDKAIKYIENNTLYKEEYDYNYEDELYLSGINDAYAKEELLEILKGEENDR